MPLAWSLPTPHGTALSLLPLLSSQAATGTWVASLSIPAFLDGPCLMAPPLDMDLTTQRFSAPIWHLAIPIPVILRLRHLLVPLTSA